MNASPQYIKTRIAPTPSGYLHLGNAYSFVLTQELAAQHDAKLLLRIDDLDRERIQDAYVQDIFDTLHFLGIDWDEGPHDLDDYKNRYSQVHRLPLYTNLLDQLKEGGHVFACTCSRAQLVQQNAGGAYPGTCRNKKIPLDTPGVNWRLDTAKEKILHLHTLNGEVEQYTLPASVKDFVIKKKDGYPAYQLASLADDLHFGIDLIIRGEDLLDSTLAQLYLAEVLGASAFLTTHFHHHPLVKDTAGMKLSKSEGALSLKHWREQGRSRAEVLRMIMGNREK